MAFQLGAGDPWPENVKLYQPYQTNQILLYQFANCLSTKAFLKMSGLSFHEELRTNAEEMSPSGEVPFLQIGKLVISEFEPIVSHIQARGFSLSQHLSEEEQADMKAYLAMMQNMVVNAELYFTWYDETMWNQVTKKRVASPFVWPVSYVLPLQKRRKQCQRLKALGLSSKSPTEIVESIKVCLLALTEKLGDQRYFFGDKPTELDALVFGHIYTLVTTTLPCRELTEALQGFPKLIKFAQMIDKKYIEDHQLERET